MTEAATIAVITVAGTVLTAVVAAVVTMLTQVNGRLRRLEHRDRLSWLYIRSLIDHGYKHAPGVPLPEPPEGWLEDTT